MREMRTYGFGETDRGAGDRPGRAEERQGEVPMSYFPTALKCSFVPF